MGSSLNMAKRTKAEIGCWCRTLEAKLSASSYQLDDFAADLRSMCVTAVRQLFPLDSDLAQKASDLLSEANARMDELDPTSRAPTPDALAEDVPRPTNVVDESFWVSDLDGVSSFLTLEAKRVGVSSRLAADVELLAEGSVPAPRIAGVKRKAKVLDEDKPAAKKVEWSFSTDLQTHLAGLIETVAAQMPDPAVKVTETMQAGTNASSKLYHGVQRSIGTADYECYKSVLGLRLSCIDACGALQGPEPEAPQRGTAQFARVMSLLLASSSSPKPTLGDIVFEGSCMQTS
jgi:hypothetical protein